MTGHPDAQPSIPAIQRRLREFAHERDWEQFHTPKNLVMALSGEIGELSALFQWLTPDESTQIMNSDRAANVREELADVAIYLIRLADVLNIDLNAAIGTKIDANAARYTVELARGNATKR